VHGFASLVSCQPATRHGNCLLTSAHNAWRRTNCGRWESRCGLTDMDSQSRSSSTPSNGRDPAPLTIVVLTYPCEFAARLLEHLHWAGFGVRAVVFERKNSIGGVRRVRRVIGSRRTLALVRRWILSSVGLLRAEPWRKGNFYRQYADEVVVVPDLNGRSSREALVRLSPDVAVIGGAGILRQGVFDAPRFGTLNMHPGLLPRYRGCSPICWAILEGQEVGATLHWVDSKVDAGPIVARRSVDIQSGDTLADLTRRVVEANLELLTTCLTGLSHGEQPEGTAQCSESARYYHMASTSAWRSAQRRLMETASKAAANTSSRLM
jgi:methionyl-tRNA formyltransferase